MNLLQIVQEFCGVRALPVPSVVIGSPDPQIIQIKGLLNNWLTDLVTRRMWSVNTIQAQLTTLAQEDQGSINTIAPFGFVNIVPETMFDRTQRLPVYGGTSPQEWQARKAFNITGPYYQFRLRQDRLLFTPSSPSGHEVYFEYFSNYFVRLAADGTPKKFWTLDTDLPALDDTLALAWLQWAWPKAKGFEYAEDFAQYERLLAMYSAGDNAPPTLNLAGRTCDLRPGIFVPAGSWPVSNP